MQHIVITMTGKPIDPAVNNIHKNTSKPLTIFDVVIIRYNKSIIKFYIKNFM
jgi:hypothetical protein